MAIEVLFDRQVLRTNLRKPIALAYVIFMISLM